MKLLVSSSTTSVEPCEIRNKEEALPEKGILLPLLKEQSWDFVTSFTAIGILSCAYANFNLCLL